jgi:PHD/YefM family antitoxin component YafN of YafNO toxin-antitoxin module
MKTYTYSQARQKLAEILEESKKEEVIIRRRKGDAFSIVPKSPSRRSPFAVAGLRKRITRKEIIEAIRESRERAK